MCTILLPIHPEYVDKIIRQEKTYEFRTKIPRKKVDKIVVYATSPQMKVLCEVEVNNILSMNPNQLWELTNTQGGISKKDFFDYFKDKDNGYAYQIKVKEVFENGKDLREYGINFAPQGFVYLS